MCEGVAEMSATTELELGAAKRRAGPTPAVEAKTAASKTAGTHTERVVAAVFRAANGRFLRSNAADQTAGTGVPRARSKVGDEGWSRELAAKLVGKLAQGEAGWETDGDEHGKTAAHGVKAHTEAGKKRLVNMLLGLAETQATEGGFKITPADLIRLMQLHKELNPQRDRKVTVQWIEDRTE